jgi:hypothetical protein
MPAASANASCESPSFSRRSRIASRSAACSAERGWLWRRGGAAAAPVEHPAHHLNKHKLGQRPGSEIAKARIRLIIESLFSNLKRQMRREDHLAKTKPGLAQRIVQRLLALTLGIYLNILTGRPPRALGAYDGR